MFWRSDDGDESVAERVKARETRSQDRDCDFCGTSEGSVVVNREDDSARCRSCLNDPDTYEDQ